MLINKIHNRLKSTSVYNGIITILICVIIHILFTCDISIGKILQRDVDLIKIAYQNGFIDGTKYIVELDEGINTAIHTYGGIHPNNKALIDRLNSETKNYLNVVIGKSGGIVKDAGQIKSD